MRYCFDIDGTICSNTNGDYKNALPLIDRIQKINDLYDEGNEIILFTARGSTTNVDWKDFTEQQLREWDVKFHELLFNKPEADLFIDDKGVSDSLFFEDQ